MKEQNVIVFFRKKIIGIYENNSSLKENTMIYNIYLETYILRVNTSKIAPRTNNIKTRRYIGMTANDPTIHQR